MTLRINYDKVYSTAVVLLVVHERGEILKLKDITGGEISATIRRAITVKRKVAGKRKLVEVKRIAVYPEFAGDGCADILDVKLESLVFVTLRPAIGQIGSCIIEVYAGADLGSLECTYTDQFNYPAKKPEAVWSCELALLHQIGFIKVLVTPIWDNANEWRAEFIFRYNHGRYPEVVSRQSRVEIAS